MTKIVFFDLSFFRIIFLTYRYFVQVCLPALSFCFEEKYDDCLVSDKIT